jgi:hypothetical protein
MKTANLDVQQEVVEAEARRYQEVARLARRKGLAGKIVKSALAGGI